jgi:quercetin dioxygenase-like cupin family protein
MRIIVLLLASIVTAAGAAPAPLPKPAPDPLAVAYDNYRVVLENDQVRVLEHTVAVGGSEAAHHLPCRLTYAMSQGGYKLVTQRPGGPRTESVRQPRSAWWSGAEDIALKNSGNQVARELIVEFKQPLPGATDCTTVGAQQLVSIAPAGLAWSTDAGKVARARVLGDATVDGPFVQRVKLPAGYKSGRRAFDREISATVLGGELKVSIVDAGAQPSAVQSLPAGSYLRIPAGVVHEEWSERGAELELRGVGPLSQVP